MGDPLELKEAQEPAGALDRVHGAEDAREHVTGVGVSVQCEEVAVQPVEALVALDEELRNDLVHLARHVRSPLPCFEGPRAERARRPEPLEQRLLSDFRPRSKGSLGVRLGENGGRPPPEHGGWKAESAPLVGPRRAPVSWASRRQQGRSRAHNPVLGTCRGSEPEMAASVRVSAVCGDAIFISEEARCREPRSSNGWPSSNAGSKGPPPFCSPNIAA